MTAGSYQQTLFGIVFLLLFYCSGILTSTAGAQAPPVWELVWQDDFNTLDEQRWTLVDSMEPTNNSLQAYLPKQLSISNGKLVITATDEAYEGFAYRSGQIISKTAQRLGRWEVRANLPTSQGMWPAIWLLPNIEKHPWPSGGEIDIMENRGNQPLLVSSAFHYGSHKPFRHDFVLQEHHTANPREQINYHNGYHTYAVDWTEGQVRFYVDDVHHYTVYDADVDGFLTQHAAPMQLMINNAIGGDFLPNPNEETKWPQKMLVNWVRVYKQAAGSAAVTFRNGSFEENGGSLAGWSVIGNSVTDNSNVSVRDVAVIDGDASLKLFGQFKEGKQHSGVSQGISVRGGQTVEATVDAFVKSTDGLAGTRNSAVLRIEFYDHFGAKSGSANMLGEKELQIADSSTRSNRWFSHELTASAPAGAVEARISILFVQPKLEGGAVHFDAVGFQVSR